jgi:hypothetical protein
MTYVIKEIEYKSREIVEGVNGSGDKVYCVQTVMKNGRVYQETFDRKSEAEAWIRWA